MSAGAILVCLYVFVMACVAGVELIKAVPTTLHTPLMSGSNAISGITIVGAIVALAAGAEGPARMLAFVGLVFASVTVFGGYAVTGRMLNMFKKN